MPDERRRAYLEALSGALADGRARLERGESALDVVEALVVRLEDEALFNAGRGAVFNAEGTHELDAAIMDGATLACGAVAGVTTVRHPVTLARRVMERSGHVLLAGAGAERFADEAGVERVPNEWFSTPARREEFEKRRAEEEKKRAAAAGGHGTVGAVALDRAGHLAAATSTGGMLYKRWGRVGDVPIVGAGTYADDRTVAVSCTGKGEEFIRHGVARELAALVAHAGLTPEQAAKRLLSETLEPGDGGLIALGRDGSIALAFNTEGMFRAAADARGRFETAIW
ncbi:MAG: isoaspartyl peptidase/L-asparaginase [Thermoanaerobaculia bacterium]|nr:MAG: isoaspartyl peptidase/L-asparaginase [Thermoanaerobaculia bacterium]